MNSGKLVKRSGIVIIIVASLLILIAAYCVINGFVIWDTFSKTEDSIGKVIAAILIVVLIGLLVLIGIICFLFGIINLITGISLLKGGSDLNVLKNKRKRIVFSIVVLFITAGGFLGIGLILLFARNSGISILSIIAFAVGIICLVLAILLIKTLKEIKKLRELDNKIEEQSI